MSAGVSVGAFSMDIDRLRQHLGQHGLDLQSVPERLPGGLANLNFRVRIGGEDAVLRRPPPGDLPPGSHDMAREHRVLCALSPSLAFVPRSFHLCMDREVIGAPFQLIEYRTGTVLRGSGCMVDLPDAQSQARQLSDMMVDTLSALHAVDPERVGLGTLGKPLGFFERTARNWATRARLVDACDPTQRTVEGIESWLQNQRVLPRVPTLLHCDFKLDNCILDPRTLALKAVIDWDMSTRGDPLFDLATLLSYWAEPDDPPCMHQLAQMPTASGGFLSRAQVLQAYALRTGFEVDDFRAFQVLALFKLGVVFLQLHQRWAVDGAGDARYAEFQKLGRGLLEWAMMCTRRVAV